MKILASLALLMSIVAAPATGRAHLLHLDAFGIVVDTAERDPEAPGDRTLISVHAYNGTGNAVTLRGLTLEGHGKLGIERLRDFFVFESWQPVKFIRLEPGKDVNMAPPNYRISVPSAALSNGDFKVLADFGPLGEVEATRPGFYGTSDDAVSQQ